MRGRCTVKNGAACMELRPCRRWRQMADLRCVYMTKKLYKALIPETGNSCELLELEDCKAYTRLSIIVCVKSRYVNRNTGKTYVFL